MIQHLKVCGMCSPMNSVLPELTFYNIIKKRKMEIKGTIKVVAPVVTGTTKKGTSWAAQQYVLQTEGEKPVSILLDVFGQDNINKFFLKEGDVVIVVYYPEVNEYNGHFFGKNRIHDVRREIKEA